MKLWFKKYWYLVVIVGAVILTVAAYFIYRWYLINYGQITDSNNNTMSVDTSAAPDYRTSGIQDLGIVNNNPGNLVNDGEPWHGLVGTNGGFMVFTNLWYGLRALGLNLVTLIKDYGSIQAYVTAYAPPSQNNTAAYISYICAATGLPATAKPPLTNAMLAILIRAHAEQENGKSQADQYISDNDIQQGIALITDVLGNPLYPAS